MTSCEGPNVSIQFVEMFSTAKKVSAKNPQYKKKAWIAVK